MNFNLLLVLPDRKNQNILAINKGDEYQFPVYEKTVGENVAFDESQMYNDFFHNLTGILVYRKYTFNTDNDVVFVFEQADENSVPKNKYNWITYDEFLCGQQNDEVKEIADSVSRCYNKSVNCRGLI